VNLAKVVADYGRQRLRGLGPASPAVIEWRGEGRIAAQRAFVAHLAAATLFAALVVHEIHGLTLGDDKEQIPEIVAVS
jgi:hypothetical protein